MNTKFAISRQKARQIVAVYICFSSLWILISDTLLARLTQDITSISYIQTLKGWIFVLITSSLLYTLIRWNGWQFESESLDREPSSMELQTLFTVLNKVRFLVEREKFNQSPFSKAKGFNISILKLLLDKIILNGESELEKVHLINEFCDFKFNQINPVENEDYNHFLSRSSFLKKIEEFIGIKRYTKTIFAVIVFELERFENVKYTLGHQLAEKLLEMTAQRIQNCGYSFEPVARVGDKSLAIILEEQNSTNDVRLVIECIQQQLNLPLELLGQEIVSCVNIGVALGGYSASLEWEFEQAKDILHAAETAMNVAKKSNRVGYVLFHPSMLRDAVSRWRLETDLRRGIALQQLEVFYQPIVSLESQKIIGFEALVRWQHPMKGMISPAEFLPLAEETGLIQLIDWWVMREACQQLRIWQEKLELTEPLTLSVNLSGQLLSQVGLLEKIERILVDTGISGCNLKLEVVESAMMEHNVTETVMLEQLRGLGIQLSIDDFGTGYSSLARLRSLPIDTLKIDRSFVKEIINDEESREIVGTIITLAHSLKMDVIAEGVETREQLEELRSLGCEYGQGYFFSKPVPCEVAETLLRQATQLECLSY